MDNEFSPEQFARIASFIQERYGIRIPPEKKIMIQSRLSKRVRELRLGSLDDYIHHILDAPDGREEISRMTDLVSTHMTSFFREASHFEILANDLLPALCSRCDFTQSSPLVVWSAACSTGEEAWSLAMVLERFRQDRQGTPHRFQYAVLATDLSAGTLDTARRAIYPDSALQSIPDDLASRFVMRSRDPSRALIRIVPELRQRVWFHQMNLMEHPYPIMSPVHIIMCRNVLIYFDRRRQEEVLAGLTRVLQPGGYLVVGHAESIVQMNLGLIQHAPTVYRKATGSPA